MHLCFLPVLSVGKRNNQNPESDFFGFDLTRIYLIYISNSPPYKQPEPGKLNKWLLYSSRKLEFV